MLVRIIIIVIAVFIANRNSGNESISPNKLIPNKTSKSTDKATKMSAKSPAGLIGAYIPVNDGNTTQSLSASLSAIPRCWISGPIEINIESSL